MSEKIDGVEQLSAEEMAQAKMTPDERRAKLRLDNAVQDLQKASVGTSVAPGLSFQLLIMQVDVMIDLLAELQVFPRVDFWNRISDKVEAMASDCRRAVLSQGGASVLAGLKKPS